MTSTIKVDNIQDQDGNNIINESSNTITVGASGDTIIIPSGATITNNGTQNGFGRTGTVDWQTGSIKTATFTAANGEGYFANTSGGAFTMNLPAGTAGNIVSVVDYTNTFQTNSLTVSPNGSQKIGGIASSNALSTEGQSVTFVYVDDTEGWKNVQDSTSNVVGNEFIIATGGTTSTSGNCKIHTFTGPGTFCVSQVHPSATNNVVAYMVVAGGGGGGGRHGGGGGAGGFREGAIPTDPYYPARSPLAATDGLTVTAQAYPIDIGGGGSGVSGSPMDASATNGEASTFSSITSTGGGHGGGYPSNTAEPGGSGGGGGGGLQSSSDGGNGNTPPVSPPQGNNGGPGSGGGCSGAGGGGATAASSGTPVSGAGTAGGAGAESSITGSPVTRSGGGGGCPTGPPVPGGGTVSGGAGGGGQGVGNDGQTAGSGTANTGGGGGGNRSPGGTCGASGGGGSGVVIIRYKYQN